LLQATQKIYLFRRNRERKGYQFPYEQATRVDVRYLRPSQ